MRLLEFGKMYGDPVGSSDDDLTEGNFPAECGKALHAATQEYLISKDQNKAAMALLMNYPYRLEYLKAENSSRSLEACYSTLEQLMFSKILDRYELVKVKTRFGDERFAVEVPFAIEIVNSPLAIPVWFVGLIDAIFYDRMEQKFVVNDIKTTRMLINDYSTRFEYDEQTVPYGIVLEHMLGREIDDFKVSYLSVYLDLIEPKVKLYEFNKNRDHISDWYRGLCLDIKRIYHAYKTEFFPRATSGETCFSFNRACYFSDVCAYRDPNVIKRIMNTKEREGFFRDGKEPWILAQLEYKGDA